VNQSDGVPKSHFLPEGWPGIPEQGLAVVQMVTGTATIYATAEWKPPRGIRNFDVGWAWRRHDACWDTVVGETSEGDFSYIIQLYYLSLMTLTPSRNLILHDITGPCHPAAATMFESATRLTSDLTWQRYMKFDPNKLERRHRIVCLRSRV